VAVSRVGGCELSLACLSVTAKLLRSCYIVPMPTNLHRYYGAGYSPVLVNETRSAEVRIHKIS